MRALILAHNHVSPAGPIMRAFENRGFEIEEMLVVPSELRDSPNVDFTFPDTSAYDVLIPMGSPWGAWDDEKIGKWLQPELEWLREADRVGTPVFGICFGGQLLARAHGGSVELAPESEIGWRSVETDVPELVSVGPWFQFHYDRWVLPPQAREIARSDKASQAFVLRKNLALQFHPELNGDALAAWIADDAGRLIIEDGQDPEAMLEQTRQESVQAELRADALVAAFLEQVAFVENADA
jgi:GMP synthase-like glutamine amidotransferase